MSDKPNIGTMIDKYNFVVSSTSSSSKVRMTTDSSICAPSVASASRSPNLPLETSLASVES